MAVYSVSRFLHLTVIGFAALAVAAPAVGAPMLNFNGSAGVTSGGVLRLTPDVPHVAGSAFLSPAFAFSPSTSFQSVFTFDMPELHRPLFGGDGLAFVVQNDSRGSAALGTDGGSLGYGCGLKSQPLPGCISPSIAVEFDTYGNREFDPDGEHVAVLLNGDVETHYATGFPSFSLVGPQRTAWIEYNGTSKHLDVFLAETNQKPALPLISYDVDASATIGSQAYIGFTAGTGDSINAHDILNWKLDIDGKNVFMLAAVPEPSTLLFLAFGMTGLGLAIVRRGLPTRGAL